ncbi:MAG TPA: hypothetical protein DDW78_09855 [Treponema sp.]|nr:hypothetical protein [Treponema sp.]
MKKAKKGSGIILTALFAALISAGCFIHIPLPGGIPIVLQDMMAMLSGLLLGPVYGAAAVLIFLILGCIGLPVFSGAAGINVLIAGPTGGFLFGYLLSAAAGGLFLSLLLPRDKTHGTAKSYALIIAAAFLATIVLFVAGIIGFMAVTHSDLAKTLAAVLIPFIPGNLIKIAVMVLLTKKFRPLITNYLS